MGERLRRLERWLDAGEWLSAQDALTGLTLLVVWWTPVVIVAAAGGSRSGWWPFLGSA